MGILVNDADEVIICVFHFVDYGAVPEIVDGGVFAGEAEEGDVV